MFLEDVGSFVGFGVESLRSMGRIWGLGFLAGALAVDAGEAEIARFFRSRERNAKANVGTTVHSDSGSQHPRLRPKTLNPKP